MVLHSDLLSFLTIADLLFFDASSVLKVFF